LPILAACLIQQGRPHANTPLKYQNIKFMQFTQGKAEIKKGRRVVAKIYDRPTYYKAHKIPSQHAEKYPYSLELRGIARECETLEEAIFYLNKYL
jgi:hypothetical protein